MLPPSPRRPGRAALHALAGVSGLFCLVIGGAWLVTGGAWLVTGKRLILADFPNSLAEAVASAAGGAAVLIHAVARIRRELRQPATGMPHPSRLDGDG
jgi:hypothetical protein